MKQPKKKFLKVYVDDYTLANLKLWAKSEYLSISKLTEGILREESEEYVRAPEFPVNHYITTVYPHFQV